MTIYDDGRRQPPTSPPTAEPQGATRERILEAAEGLFRSFGYSKTTVADIARALGMSPANVYRFFDSKRAIFEALAIALMANVRVALAAAADQPGPARGRLVAFLEECNAQTTASFVGDAHINDMIQIAINENWEAIRDHVEACRRIVERVIQHGVAAGEFPPQDPALSSSCVMAAWLRFCHPELIMYENMAPPLERRDLIDFILRALDSPPAR